MAVFVAGALGAGAWTALAQSVITPTTPNPLPGSQFQGGDGNEADASGLIDWQGLQADGRVGHTSDPQAQDDIFAGGTKELQPGGWSLTTQAGGEAPPKDNILDIYRAFDHPQNGDAFLYLAFTRQAGDGTTFLTFELNQNPLRWGPDQLPCRTTGDILITFDEQGNGVEVEVDRWVTDTTLSNGCANTGHLVTASNLQPNVDVQGSFNSSGAINNYLPGFFPIGSGTIPTDQFGETAINLTTVLGGLGEGCTVFGSSWAHSRASLSDTSQLKDYVAPQPFHIRTCKASPDLTSTASGLVNPAARGKHRLRRHLKLTPSLTIHDTATLSGGDNPTGPITFKLFDDADCAGTPIFTDTQTANGAGSYRSADYRVTAPGTYHWIVEYAGDDDNNGAGPTACGDNTETAVISPATPALTTTASGPVRRRRVTTGEPGHRRVRTLRVHTGRAAQTTFDTATISGGIAPTGMITFKLYGPNDPDCSRAPFAASTATVNGNGSYESDPATPTDAGTYFWVATYSGDTFNSSAGPTACGDPAETIVIAKARPAISTEASGAVDLGGEITDSATLTGGASPTGTITFDVYGPNNDTCSGTPADSSNATVSGNGTYSSQPFKPTATGTYRWLAHYSGDDDNEAAATSCSDPAEAQAVGHPTVQPSLTTIAGASSALAPAGSPIRDAATLSGGSNPTGTIAFAVYGPNDNSCATAAGISTAAVSGNGTYLSATFTPTKAGTYHWVARYLGDETNDPAGPTACDDPLETIVVSKAQPTFSTSAVPSVTLPDATHDTATLDGVNPIGTITFELFGPDDSTCSAAPVFTTLENVDGDGTYTSADYATSHPGTYHWVATYSGDANNNAAATHCGDSGESTVVLPHQPVLASSASPPAYLKKGSRVQPAGVPIYDSATLSDGFDPTGEITFDLYGPNNPTCSEQPILTTATAVAGNGIYNSESYTPTQSGTYRWVATYSGDANDNGAGPTACRDSAERVDVTVPADPSLITSASNAVTLGGAVTDTATLTGGSAPTGTITFRLYSPSDTTCTSDVVFTSTVGVNGNGNYTSGSFTPTDAGAYHWVASYSGDSNNHPAATTCGDAGETVVVRPHNITPVTPGLSTTASPPALGGPIYDTAHLSGGTDPGGAITFQLFGPGVPSCSGPPAFTTVVAVDGNGDYRSASFVVSKTGTYRWVATYAGDALNSPVASLCGDPAETLTVNPGPAPDPSPGANVPTRGGRKPVKPTHRHKPPSKPKFTG